MKRDLVVVAVAAVIAVLVLAMLMYEIAHGETLPLGTVSHLAHEAALRYGLPQRSADRLVCLAWHESSFRPDVNQDGLMQFQRGTWFVYAQRIGYASDLRKDPTAAIDVAAYMGSISEWFHWTPVLDGRC